MNDLYGTKKGKYFILAKITVQQGDRRVINFYMYMVTKCIK